MSEFSRALRTIDLQCSTDGPMVVLPEGDGQPAQEPFVFPHLPWSTMNWLGALGDRVWDQHEVCCALLLLINPARRCWGVTCPPQQPREDGVSWQMTDAVPMGNNPETPRHIGGTFQMARADSPEQVLELIPTCDGLHLIHPVGMELAGAWSFLRVQGQLSLRNSEEIVFDDWGMRMDEVIRVLGLSS